MAGITAGATFTFAGFTAQVTGISAESPVAEVADMTSASDSSSMMMLVPTGGVVGGSVSIDYLAQKEFPVPSSLVRKSGSLLLASPEFKLAVNAILESVSVTAQAGELVRGTLRFRPTDVY